MPLIRLRDCHKVGSPAPSGRLMTVMSNMAARIRTHVPRDGFFFSNLERRGIEAAWLH
jgi:hypothetical protein